MKIVDRLFIAMDTVLKVYQTKADDMKGRSRNIVMGNLRLIFFRLVKRLSCCLKRSYAKRYSKRNPFEIDFEDDLLVSQPINN